jgi:Carboxypeptidase regulatory-like domain
MFVRGGAKLAVRSGGRDTLTSNFDSGGGKGSNGMMRLGVVAILALLTSCFTLLRAQQSTAVLTGTVTDRQNAVIAGAQVEITSLETNVTTTVATNASGIYVAPALPVGHYRVTASNAGFKREVRDDIELRVGDRVEVDFELEVGSLSEQVTVTSDTALLETQSATHGQVIDTKSVRDLPLLGRNPFTLTLLSTGVTWANPQPSVSSRPWDNNGMDNFNINGSRGLTNAVFLDGIPNTASEAGAAANIGIVPPPDATAEFKVQTNSYDAEYGRTEGGIINVTLRGGTNQLHGSLYDFERNTIFDANQFQNNAAGIPRSAFRWHEPGVVVGGPVYFPKLYDGRNKSFFMANWEGISMIQPGTAVDTVPTVQERSGNFSDLRQSNGQAITIYDPLTTHLVNGQYL